MMEENGPIRAALYVRVSTDKQADHGYSLDGQREELRRDVTRVGRAVVAEVVDGGEKRWNLDRPGIERLRELAASGEVEEVWAWRWDRFGESPWPEVLAIEMEGYGVALRSLDDGGEGEDAGILRVLRSAMAKKERARTTERARMGMFAKARRGEVSGSAFAPRYGFGYVRNDRGKAVGYEVDPEKMATVRRIFEMLAGGESLHAVQRELEQAAIPAPGGGQRWSRTTLRNMAQEDAYLPRMVDELAGLVPADVLARLDHESPYGIVWYGRRRSRYTGKGKARKVELQPRENWVAIPVSLAGSGLERSTVERTRAAVEDNRAPSKTGGRFWELSGGVLRCGDCGRAMIAYRRQRRGGGYLNYYRCRPSSTLDTCPNRKSHPAEALEYDAARTFEWYASSETLLELYDQAVRELEEEAGLRGTQERRTALGARLEAISQKRRGFQEQQAENLMTLGELRERLGELSGEKAQIEAELGVLGDATLTARRLKAARLSIGGVSEEWEEDPDAIQPWDVVTMASSPETIRRAYRRYGARFEVDGKGVLTLRLDLSLGGEALRLTSTTCSAVRQAPGRPCSPAGSPG